MVDQYSIGADTHDTQLCAIARCARTIIAAASELPSDRTMYEEYQIEIPQSFMALFIDPGRSKPNASRDVVASRYEFCEDMASMLTETARNMFLSLGITEDDVLMQCYRGLTGGGAVVTKPEAGWVIHRLAELLEWPLLRSFDE